MVERNIYKKINISEELKDFNLTWYLIFNLSYFYSNQWIYLGFILIQLLII